MADSHGEGRPTKGDVKDIWWFLVILFSASAVFYVVGPLIGTLSSLTRANVPAAALAVVCPTIAAVVVAARTGAGGRLMSPIRACPHGAIYWLISMIALPAVVMLSALLTGQGGDLEVPGTAALGLASLYLLASLMEEVGWTAFLLPRLVLAMGETVGAVVIGAVWAVWHVIPYVQAGHPTTWVLGQCFFTIVFRILIMRLVIGSGGSVWLAVFCHASYNLAWSLSPDAGAAYDPWIAATLTAAIVAILYVLPTTRPTSFVRGRL